ncbi:hypothetical protein PB1_04340 [Bacillus methanolicus PB1]|uniref:Uncharacterized protein n=1 Tax=Bacillus methanolicus PB1 TaxID=997296 RepID=I3E6L5_BACMT|nr:hypothetical protein PB1_04340 [Bacillus methanolicus PB1]
MVILTGKDLTLNEINRVILQREKAAASSESLAKTEKSHLAVTK